MMKYLNKFILFFAVILFVFCGCEKTYDKNETSAEIKMSVSEDEVELDKVYENEITCDSESSDGELASLQEQSQIFSYVANKNSGKLHYPDCASVRQMNEENKLHLRCTRDEALSKGYKPCLNRNKNISIKGFLWYNKIDIEYLEVDYE